ncbi:DUF4878 domain-containing protein [uncultured Helicobacter sp.]|uniref:DUF4878 domain-containing protein n=1 Tax=uncultured Helicobacter sp. TaxID=175537 RepID=UPI0026230D5B|nr:DUF4878 domain-containing protein [uncultured Helicobacter sp.]
MKNLKKLCFAFVLGVFLSACGSSSPEEIALDFTKAVYAGDTKAVMKFFDLEGAKPEEVAFAEGKIGLVLSQAKKTSESKGGVKEVVVADKKITENKAIIQTKVIFKDGSEDLSGRTSLIKKDNTWFVELK